MKLPHVNKRPLARKRVFVQAPFSQLHFKIRTKTIHSTKPLAFSLHLLFRRHQNHYNKLTSKIMKKCEILNTAGILPENSRNCFVNLQSKKKTVIKDRKKIVFLLKADMLYFDLKSVKFLLPLLAALK